MDLRRDLDMGDMYVDGGTYPPRLCLWQQPSLWDRGIRNDDSMIIQGLNHNLRFTGI